MKIYFCYPESEPDALIEQTEFREQRTVAGLSPIDFELECTDLLNVVDHRISVTPLDVAGPKPSIQLKFPMVTFWTYDPDIWIYQYDHPMTSLNNNFVTIGAWWNLSKWVRNINTAVVPVDVNYPISIKKGDPLYRVSFYHKDMKGDIILEQMSEDQIPQDMRKRREEQDTIIENKPSELPNKLFTPYDHC
tara:strand:+ start:2851 stop:3423 length:573 start_codon:yes stop_codon:yes gene_type:complete